MREPLLLEIRGNSLDDGPGIRSVVFFKGCPLSCAWCHNPESKRAEPELAFDAERCVGCDACLAACPEKALSRKRHGFIDRARCTLCFRCADACPSGALARVGRVMTVEEAAMAVMKDKPFFDTSGGGVTLSGGEPTLFMEYAGALLRLLKGQGVRTLLETCGLFDMARFRETMLHSLDEIYFDIKLIDEAAHRRYTGASNVQILENLLLLLEETGGTAVSVLPRTPLVPGITDTEENLSGIAGLLAAHGVRRASLMSYNPLWHQKAEMVGADDPFGKKGPMHEWMEAGSLRRCRDIFARAGIEV
ncbi:MAG: glycyl-radical enzyme activating protein [Spirochaetes bacterium]|nr:glycyl-radical enzyme activating protein [Spirochaetota bacterium]